VDGASAAVDASMIRSRTRLGFDESENLLEKMLDAGWVGRIKVDQPKKTQWGKRITEGVDTWTLLANPQQVTVADVYRLFVYNASGNRALAQQVEGAIEQGLRQTLAEHFGKESDDAKKKPGQLASANT
jgi:membrane protein